MASKLALTLIAPTRSSTTSIQRPFVSVSSSSHSFLFDGRQLCLRRRRSLVLPAKAAADQQQGNNDVVDSNVLQYCSIDKKQKKSLGEMEQDFLQALQSFYYDRKAIMSNEEFDILKEELMWEGSSVVMLSSDEHMFLEASMAYVSGNPILSYKEFDELKMRLKADGSDIAVEGPRCSLRTVLESDLSVDYLKMLLLNVPATVVALGAFFFLDDLTGFEITYLLELPEPYSFIFTWFAAVPVIVYLATQLTKLIVKDVLILKGPCPNCGTENNSFFGSILSIPNGGATNNLKCSNCKTVLVYYKTTRSLPEGSSAYIRTETWECLYQFSSALRSLHFNQHFDRASVFLVLKNNFTVAMVKYPQVACEIPVNMNTQKKSFMIGWFSCMIKHSVVTKWDNMLRVLILRGLLL